MRKRPLREHEGPDGQVAMTAGNVVNAAISLGPRAGLALLLVLLTWEHWTESEPVTAMDVMDHGVVVCWNQGRLVAETGPEKCVCDERRKAEQ